MVRNDAIKTSTNDPVGSRSTFPTREPVQQILQDWIEAATGRVFLSSFVDSLRDGVTLCRLINRIEPNRIQDVVESPDDDQALENLKKVISECDNLGLCEWQLFNPEDLHVKITNNEDLISASEHDITQEVISTLYFLGCIVNTMSHYNGPQLNISRLHRNTDGVIVTKRNGATRARNTSNLSAMYGGDSEDDIDEDTSRLNGNLLNGINGYENEIQSFNQPSEFSVNVRIMGEEKRFGFSVMGGIDEGFPPRIDNIVNGSPAERANLRIGDELLEVNGVPLLNFSHMEVISSIHKCLKTRVIALKLIRGGDSVEGGFSTFMEDPSNDQQDKVDSATQKKLNSIIKDQENDPQFPTNNSDAETNSINSYGQLESPSNMRHSPNWSNENLILNNNGLENGDAQSSNLTKHKSWSTAVLDLRQLDEIDADDRGVLSQENDAYDTESNCSTPGTFPYEPQPVSPINVLSVESFPSQKTTHILTNLDEIKPRLTARSDQERVVYVEEYLAAEDVQNATKIYSKIMELKYERKGPGYSKPVSTSSHNLITQVSTSLSNSSRSKEERELEELIYSPNFQGLLLAHDTLAFREALPDEDEDEDEEREEIEQQHSFDDQVSQVEDDTVKIVRIDKSADPLGATVKNEDGSVVIGRIVKGGAAEKSGLLHEGDEILEINGVNMKGRSVAQVCELLEDMNGTLTFLVIPNNRVGGSLNRQQHAVHVKAHFDYDPENDELIPCRELGLVFRKGAILHIVNQDDPNWWQAWRAGEEGKKLAGLIPSKSFQQQRESLKHTLPTEKESNTKDKRKCLCIKKKRRKKVLYNAKQNDDLEDQTLTYEEVALLYPNSSRKRPIVLVGPAKVGRKEVRQRLFQYNPDRFVPAIPHTSKPKDSDEVNGRDYHFISRRTFESDIVANKYVEHGELHGHYFATSFDSIKTVINNGRTCVLNFSCEALKSLRASDVRPYVVFISPASFERIKALRTGKVDPFNPKIENTLSDNELHSLIDYGRQMEDTYGHLFDYTIVNTNLERTFDEILQVIDRLERDPDWAPVSWVR
ncbi:hypothetical protein QZH41_016036 [Actinostola sp. cb2023]|nr:hypothetical protein QZH41_016036 [Actinostola sp. cb2023]